MCEVGAVPTQVLHAELLQDHDIAQAMGLLEQGGFSDAELTGYDTVLDQTTTYISMLADAKAEGWARGWAEGEAQGRAEGEAEGRAEAEARSRVEGKAKGERAKALAIASAALVDGLSLERVAAATGLSVEELRAL